MLKKFSLLFAIFNILLCFMLKIDFVSAITSSISVEGSEAGTTQSCSGGNCYSLGTGGMRVALLKKDGTIIGSPIDLWYFGDSQNARTTTKTLTKFDFNPSGVSVRFSQKKLRQSYISTNTVKGLLDIGSNFSITPIENNLPHILEGMTSDWSGDTYHWSNKKLNVRVPNVTEIIMERISDNIKGNINLNGNQISQYTYLNNLLSALGTGLNANNLTEEYYLQFEPLVSWQNHSLGTATSSWNGNSKSSYIFYGTITELYLLFQDVDENSFSPFCVTNGGGVANSVNVKENSTQYGLCYNDRKGGIVREAFNRINANSFYEIANIGIYSKSTMFSLTGVTSQASSRNNAISSKAHAFGVGYISLSDLVNRNCSDQVVDLIEKNKFNSGLSEIIKTFPAANWLNNYGKYGFSSLQSLKNYLQGQNDKSCPRPNCETSVGMLYSRNSWTSLLEFIRNEYDKLRSIDSSNLSAVETFKSRLLDVDSTKYCSSFSCSDILSDIKSKSNYALLGTLSAKFSDYDFLNEEFLAELGLSPSDAKCGSAPKCPVETTIASCQAKGKNIFTLQDTDLVTDKNKNKAAQCLSNGIAYNYLGEKNDSGEIIPTTKQKTQTSYDTAYGTKAYCWESVEFKFPTTGSEEYDVISGKLLKWGINTDTKNSNFGTMTVTRKCYATKDSVDVSWPTSRIEPKIQISYTPAIPNDASVDESQIISVRDVDLAYNLTSYSIDGRDELESATNRSYNCGRSCKNKEITMVATYDLNYGNSLKWYASAPQSINGNKEIVNYEENSSDIDSSNSGYTWLGYGLPTTFLTPTNVNTTIKRYGKYDFSSIISGTTSGSGALYATVSQIGTKSNTGYHFDKLVNFAINDDNDNTTNDGKIYYNCEYRVKNNLFDYESGDGDDFVTPKGIDVVFRTIDLMDSSTDEELNEAFPGMSGAGLTGGKRKMGANWDEIYQGEIDNVFDILKSSIYSNEPMYEITLDVATIQNIRVYNRNARSININGNKYDPYTSMPTNISSANANNGFLGYSCKRDNNIDESTYRYCASNFLTKLYDDRKLSGTCMTISSTYDRADSYKNGGCHQ